MKISYKVLFAAVLSIAGTNAFAATADITGLATTNYVKGAIQSLDGDVTGTTGVVKTISQTDGKITATRGTISGDDVSSIPNTKITGLGALATRNDVTETQISGNISQGKITNLTADLAAKQTTGNMIKKKTDVTETNMESETNYPSMAAAQQIASAVVAENLIDVNQEIESLNTNYTNLSNKVESNKTAADNAIKGLTGTGTGTTAGNGMVKTVTQENGVVTATRGLVATADIADGAVDSKKIKDGEVKEADIGAQAVSTAKIKSPTTTECASGNCALVDLGTGAQWLPIVNEYN